MKTKKTALEKVMAIVDANLVGASEYRCDGWWHQVKRHRVRYNWELWEIDAIKKEHPECIESDSGQNYTLIVTDTAKDIEYAIVVDRSPYIGKPDHIIFDKTYNVSVANS